MKNAQVIQGTQNQNDAGYWMELYEKAQVFLQSIDRHGMSLKKGVFVCSEKRLNLNSKSNALSLIAILFDCENKPTSKAELVRRLFGETRGFSRQLTTAIDHNLVKRISRTRLLLIKAFGSDVYNWLPYDHESQSWCLFRVK